MFVLSILVGLKIRLIPLAQVSMLVRLPISITRQLYCQSVEPTERCGQVHATDCLANYATTTVGRHAIHPWGGGKFSGGHLDFGVIIVTCIRPLLFHYDRAIVNVSLYLHHGLQPLCTKGRPRRREASELDDDAAGVRSSLGGNFVSGREQVLAPGKRESVPCRVGQCLGIVVRSSTQITLITGHPCSVTTVLPWILLQLTSRGYGEEGGCQVHRSREKSTCQWLIDCCRSLSTVARI